MALRHTISPQLSNRPSPPITRSVSRNGHRPTFETSTPVTRRSLQPGMEIGTIERVFEQADDSTIDLNSSKFVYKEHFTVKERTSMQKEMWYDWLVYHIRMIRRHLFPNTEKIRETLLVLVLLFILHKYALDCWYDPTTKAEQPINHQSRIEFDSKWTPEIERIIEESNKNLQMSISIIKDRENQLEDRTTHLETLSDDEKGWKESVVEEIRKIKASQTAIDQLVESLKKDLEENKLSKVIITEEDRQPTGPPEPPGSSSSILLHPMHFLHRSPIGVNVANSLIGASIDYSCSSRPVSAKDGIFYDIMSYFGSFKEGYVLLDREVLTPGEAWCTYDKRPTLTVKLARFVIPTAVSYQHVRWSGIVPNHAPKLYDLVACLDSCCTQSEPLILNCEYTASEEGPDEQEQFCSIPTINSMQPINHVQFRFRENHGNMTKTCAYLVRVYGKPVNPQPPLTEQDAAALDNGTTSHLESTLVDSVPESA
ncbi:Protein CBR-SUN-1 [Caenorhabditis briggsae]|uniref:SUN domain-containing protein n=2 Tax=Caenorhabditis briggsae TaxID=6238 RepID=A0AAE9AIR9_CAEBR|nr:Protein CBR-SUN-1 [Caenorhabditis briggsae]ULT96733.1 hypothetical protein L3Y34_004938 [Caenorhabditis briggsae]ULT96734.1 hypothetical protein L3Y34_004938 [Caenorhabditis briggsae]CAP35232.1 Protein CBR-SUN-1 [Caenorhabditis briggsae]